MDLLPPLVQAPRRPAAHAEGELVSRILKGDFRSSKTLPSERELALLLGVTRPTLREALQRLDRDGWIQVRHGKATRVRDIWREGGLNMLAALVRHGGPFPPNFVGDLLDVRLALAPAYARAAVEHHGAEVAALLEQRRPEDEPEAYAEFDWALHLALTGFSENPVYTLIVNGFGDVYGAMAPRYFQSSKAREASGAFYERLAVAARKGQVVRAEAVTRAAMAESVALWRATAARLKRSGRGGR
jgi:GntR family transcriptional regulator, negative regulator for fad regulon and positive regulator of fabA